MQYASTPCLTSTVGASPKKLDYISNSRQHNLHAAMQKLLASHCRFVRISP